MGKYWAKYLEMMRWKGVKNKEDTSQRNILFMLFSLLILYISHVPEVK